MAVIAITKDSFQSQVLDSKIPVLLDLWAPWCGPCRMLAPVIEALSEEMTQVKFVKANVDEELELARHFGVSTIPLLVYIKDGQVVKKVSGYREKNDLRALLD